MEQFELDLQKLKRRVLKMCSLVDEQLQNAVKSFEEEQPELAKQVIEMDIQVDKYDSKIDKSCLKLLALRQPVASDLRYIMSAMIININLERIGDLAVNIAEIYLQLGQKPKFLKESRIIEMTALVKDMVRDALDSFINNDSELAKKVIEADDVLDQYNRESHDSMVNLIKGSSEYAEQAVAILLICRELERVGDHATNISENVFFIVEGSMIKHKYEKLNQGDGDPTDID